MMSSKMISHIEDIIDKIYKHRTAVPIGYSAVFGGHNDRVYYLRYILRCLGLPTSGNKTELIERIENHEIKVGDVIRDPAMMSSAITSKGLDDCPIYLLRVFLKHHGLSTNGNKSDLVARVRIRLGENGRIVPSDLEDKGLIDKAVRNAYQGKVPTEDEVDVMEKHGYFYDSKYNTFFHIRTHEKLFGDAGFFESIWLALYPFISNDEMEFIFVRS